MTAPGPQVLKQGGVCFFFYFNMLLRLFCGLAVVFLLYEAGGGEKKKFGNEKENPYL